eukprot:1982274-Heterocapsa_arctica.AAC.1
MNPRSLSTSGGRLRRIVSVAKLPGRRLLPKLFRFRDLEWNVLRDLLPKLTASGVTGRDVGGVSTTPSGFWVRGGLL